jgi:glycine oxidase
MSSSYPTGNVVDVAVIGAGVIGLMTAIELADAGLQVALFDQQRLGRESSWAGGGILAPLHPWLHPPALHQLHQHSLQLYPQWIDRLITQTQIDPEHYACGMTVLQHGEQAVHLRNWITQSGWQHHWQDDVLHLPDHANICNPQLLKGLRQLVSQQPLITVHEYAEVLNIESAAVITAQQKIACQHQVVAAGAWSGVLAQRLGFSLDVFPVKGQMLLMDVPNPPLTQMIMVEDHYLIPRKNGQIVVGSTVEAIGFDVLPSAAAYAQLKQTAENLYPPLAKTQILAQWCGLRPGSTQALPLIGQHPAHQNLWINSGHFRNGLCLAPASVRLLVQQMLGKDTDLSIGSFQQSIDTWSVT